MRAVLYDKRNSPDALVLRVMGKPIPGDHEVLVKIYAVSVNAADYRFLKLLKQ
jgi:NADPH:quinone reductase and related Zn-dependent oxidoreductases